MRQLPAATLARPLPGVTTRPLGPGQMNRQATVVATPRPTLVGTASQPTRLRSNRHVTRQNRPTPPGRRAAKSQERAGNGLFSARGLPPSIVSAAAFHFRVRDGNGWDHRAPITSSSNRAARLTGTPLMKQDTVSEARRTGIADGTQTPHSDSISSNVSHSRSLPESQAVDRDCLHHAFPLAECSPPPAIISGFSADILTSTVHEHLSSIPGVGIAAVELFLHCLNHGTQYQLPNLFAICILIWISEALKIIPAGL